LTNEQSSSYCNRDDKNDENCESSLRSSKIENISQIRTENEINNDQNSNQVFEKPDHMHEDYNKSDMESANLDSNIILTCCQSTYGSSEKIDSYNNEYDEDMVQTITNDGSEENREEIEKYEYDSSYDSPSSNFNNSEGFQYKVFNGCNESRDEKLRQAADIGFDRTAPFESYE
jgi:translation initiation factor 2 beta subunit (eIF-2beta)/eIF-5